MFVVATAGNHAGRGGNVVHASFGLKSAVWFVNIWGLLIVSGCAWDVHRRSVGILRSSGLPRRKTEAVLAAGRNVLSRGCLFHWTLLV
jgi:hypothetical protein